ncbi:UDP-3-O-(3-hydroxymyristoyl)glucosamine N-acyltransferase [Devosia sp. PTR5]|uniref:UDP-3-O-acylglucosamine N-acyltransferase n=1 Tax=Devosia oryzisoli TaxID=2774138 RepID=A0A927FSG6_9HYPH|nr:UDP-3-O-(3-hydroxymyristoyl)glucosamine N-acyltransferase [Devosia oryzisoli]MBD8064597.1 UDP-3-O-(3-hydroxymyristoyl)glucosamine N-acyltransferase [Devosia oryzisoli]
MVDTRFHRFAGDLPLAMLLHGVGRDDLVEALDGRDITVSGVAEPSLAVRGDVVLAAQASYAQDLRHTKAGVAIVSAKLAGDVPAGTIAVVADRPHELFVDILDILYPGSTRSIISADRDDLGAPVYERDVSLGANVVIGAGVEIGRGTVVGANTVIGPGVTIGRNCTIAANCTIDCAHLGNDVTLHSGVRVGTEGFGWLDHGRGNRKIPQLGRVIIQDRVEIGANSTIDRGALGDTVIGDGTKIDNLVQIGHNCRIGRNCLIAAMSGLSGSTIVGDGVLMGGGVGTSGHLEIGSGTVIFGRAAVTKDWPPGSKLAGAPAQDIKDFWREMAAMRKLSKGDKRG